MESQHNLARVAMALAVLAGDGLPDLTSRGTGNCNRRNHYCGADDNGGRPIEAPARPGRNAPCPCGSRRKFKACCLGRD